MQIALIVGLSILLALGLAAGPFGYSFYIYSKNRIFTKSKLPILLVVLSAFMVVCFIALIAIFAINKVTYWATYVALSSVLLLISCAYLVFFILIPKLVNKNKISLQDMQNVDWNQKLNELKQKAPDMEAIKAKLIKCNKKYYTSMLEYYEHVLKRAKDEKISLNEKMADIVTFNEAFSHKWSSFLNNFQLSLTYQYLALFQKNETKNNF